MKKIFYFFIFLLSVISCKEAYYVPSPSPPTGYLVVEGFINNGDAPTRITLTRTTKLYDSVNIIYERNAQVNIEGENGESFPLHESTAGIYLSSPLSLNSNEKYHLHIRTTDGKEYLSDYATVKSTPPIDSISWKRDNGVQIFVNTHDPQNNTRYYQWNYEETWEFHSAYKNNVKYVFDSGNYIPVAVGWKFPTTADDTTIFKCWSTVNSTSITLGSSEKLSEDRIHLQLINIEPGSVKLSVMYSINLRQYALSRDAYAFFQKIKKNTEQLGSVFDAQPSELQGNIHCVTDPSETVIGWVEISNEQVQRIFIKNDQVPDWEYNPDCLEIEVANKQQDIYLVWQTLAPATAAKIDPFGGIISFYAALPRCVDCTLSGTNVKPDFWP